MRRPKSNIIIVVVVVVVVAEFKKVSKMLPVRVAWL